MTIFRSDQKLGSVNPAGTGLLCFRLRGRYPINRYRVENGFVGAALKVRRAKDHIGTLKTIVDRFEQATDSNLEIRNLGDGVCEVQFASTGLRGALMPLAIGDAIHNLRAAYDHLWNTLSREAQVQGRGYFPFNKNKTEIEKILTKCTVAAQFPALFDIVCSKIRPFSDCDGDKLLWSITKFDNLDKHNLIIPILHVHNVSKMNIYQGDGVIEIEDTIFENIWNSVYTGPGRVDLRGSIKLSLLFPEDSVLPRAPVIETLCDMAAKSKGAVDIFTQEFLGKTFDFL